MVIISEQSVDSFLNILNPDGILGMIGVGQISTPLLLEVHRIGLLIVLVDHEDPLIPSDTIFVNNVDCMVRMTNHLLGTGHQSLQFIGNARFSRSFRDRFIGYRSAMEENGLHLPVGSEVVESLEGLESSDFADNIRSWILKKKKAKAMPTAIICANDLIAKCTLGILQEFGIGVPSEVSVTGFDNLDESKEGGEPALTTVHVPKEAMGRRAVERLLTRINHTGEPMEKTLLAGDVLYRDSTAVAKEY